MSSAAELTDDIRDSVRQRRIVVARAKPASSTTWSVTDSHERLAYDRAETDQFRSERKPGSRASVEQTMRQVTVVLYVLALVSVVVGVDILFFRHQFWERLIVNIGIVLVFLAFGLRFLKRT